MGRIKSNEDIKAPEPDEPTTSVPANSQPGVVEEAESPKPDETVVSFPPNSQSGQIEEAETPKLGKTVVSFPPETQPGQREEIEMVQTAEPVASLPPNPTVALPVGNPWSTGLFDCSQDPTNAIMTAFFPCVTFGQIAEVLDAGKITCPLGSLFYFLMMPSLCSSWIMGSRTRKKLRMKFGLVEAPYQDVFSHVFCPFCSLCQEFRELKNRGIDPAVGWNGILAQQQQQAMVHNNPPPIQAMSK